MSIQEKVLVSAIVKTKAEAPDGFAIELEIASFNSQYPTKVTRIPEAIASQLKVGQAVNLNLNRQGLKKKADGTMKSGNYPTDYYWGIEGIAQNAPTQGQGTATQPPANTPTRDLRDESIKQQVAVKEIGAMIVSQRYVPPELIVKYWQTIAEWLSCGSITLAAPNPPSTTQNVPQQGSGEIFWPHFATIGDMMTFGTKQGVLMQEFASFLGVQKVIDWKGTPDEAWNIIATKKNLKPEHAK